MLQAAALYNLYGYRGLHPYQQFPLEQHLQKSLHLQYLLPFRLRSPLLLTAGISVYLQELSPDQGAQLQRNPRYPTTTIFAPQLQSQSLTPHSNERVDKELSLQSHRLSIGR